MLILYPNKLTFISRSRGSDLTIFIVITGLILTVLSPAYIANSIVCCGLPWDLCISRHLVLPFYFPNPLIVVGLLRRHSLIAILHSKWAVQDLIERALLIQSTNDDSLTATVLTVELSQDLLPACHKVEPSNKLLDRLLLLASSARLQQTLERKEIGDDI